MESNVPRELWLYDDRCMKKWQGWILSDHSQYMENETAAEAPVQPLAEQPFAVINERLQRSWENALVVSIQSSDVYGGNYSRPVEGACVGLSDGQCYLQGKDGAIHAFSIEDMRL